MTNQKRPAHVGAFFLWQRRVNLDKKQLSEAECILIRMILPDKSRRALVIVAHPDDETLWMGGMILMHRDWDQHSALDGTPQGQDWQTWSASMYIYAADCVLRGSTPFFEEMRSW